MGARRLFGSLQNAAAVLRARWYFRSATECGPRVRIWGRAIVNNEGTLTVGNRVRLVAKPVPVEMGIGPNGHLAIGDNVYINYGTSIAATQSVRIGSNVHIGTYVLIMDNDFHRLEPERRHEMPPSAPVIIGDDVWIGARAMVLRGVTIGTGSVVAAGSVVVKDVPPRSVVAGVPATFLRSVDDEPVD